MKLVIGLMVAALFAGGIALYGLIGGGASSVEQAPGVEPDQALEVREEKPERFAGETTLAALQALGPQLECRISYVDPETAAPIVGTYFVNGEQIRGDFEMNTPELGSFVSSVIMSEGVFYSWSNIGGQTFGVTADLTGMENTDTDTLREPVPSDETVSYECDRWENVDGSIFLPPGDVLFQDVDAILQAGMEFGTVYEEGEF